MRLNKKREKWGTRRDFTLRLFGFRNVVAALRFSTGLGE